MKLPEGWKQYKLGHFLREVTTRNRSQSGIPVLSVTNSHGFVVQDKYFSRQVSSKDVANYKIVRKGQFAYNPSRINVGSLARLDEFDQGLLSPMYVVFECSDEIDSDFLLYWLESPRVNSQIRSSTQGTVRESLSFSALSSFTIIAPPLDEQRRIAEILGSIDLAISASVTANEQTQLINKSMINELLFKGIGHSEFQKTTFGAIPKKWNVKTIREITLSCKYGLNDSLDSEESGIPILRMNNIQEGEIDLTSLKYVATDTVKISDYLLKEGDLLFNRTNSQELVGKVGIVRGGEKLTFASYLLRLVINRDIVLPDWLNLFMNDSYCQRRLKNIATPGVGQVNINAQSMLNLPCPIPSLDEQKKIINIILSLKEHLATQLQYIQKLKQIKSDVSLELFTGKENRKFKIDGKQQSAAVSENGRYVTI